MKHVISELEIALQILTNNEPINRRDGNFDQADLQALKIAEFSRALEILRVIDREHVMTS